MNKTQPVTRYKLVQSRRAYERYKDTARLLVEERIARFNPLYHLSYNALRIKNQKTRWASCSKKGNLNFSFRIVFLPPELADYLVVHELCHLRELNHSPAFWSLVAVAFPHYRDLCRALRMWA